MDWWKSGGSGLVGLPAAYGQERADVHHNLIVDISKKWKALREERNFPEADKLKGQSEMAGLILKWTGQDVETELLQTVDAEKLRALL